MNIGKIFLVGAGPGDPELISVKGLKCLNIADVVLHDRLIDLSILKNAKSSAEIINVGKTPGDNPQIQNDINQLMVKKAFEGKNVVRLKGGDPFIFGRGSEEALYLNSFGIEFEIIPGISSINGVSAYAGIPLTHRGISSSFTVLTGTEILNEEEKLIGFNETLKFGDTIIVLMGLKNINNIIDVFINRGLSKDTPIALVGFGTMPNQNTIVGSLKNIISKLQCSKLSSPVVVIIGEVVKLRKQIKWYDNKPLFGKNVLITRAHIQSSSLARLFSSKGANPIEFPTIEIKPIKNNKILEENLNNSKNFDWILFTSQNAVKIFFDRMFDLGKDIRHIYPAQIGAIGNITSEYLKSYGVVPDIIGENNNSSDFIDEFKGVDFEDLKILLPKGKKSKSDLYDALISRGAFPTNLEIYDTVLPNSNKLDLYEIINNGLDVCTFTSPSTVENLIKFLQGDLNLLSKSKIACIGSVTAKTAQEIGLKVEIISEDYTIEGLVEAVENYYIREAYHE